MILINILYPITATIEFFRILRRRLETQGLRTTLLWLYAVGMAKISGRVALRYSRVTPHLYIGPQFGRRGKSALEKAGISASVSMRAEFNDAKYGLAMPEYTYLPTIDNTAPSIEHLVEGVEFIRTTIENEGSVYVHCGSGVGRAPTMVVAYLLATGLSMEEAIHKVKVVRPFIRILPDQMERLHEFEIYLATEPEKMIS